MSFEKSSFSFPFSDFNTYNVHATHWYCGNGQTSFQPFQDLRDTMFGLHGAPQIPMNLWPIRDCWHLRLRTDIILIPHSL